jgi:aryl-alcohol dehydrogenase-like predicted oxidoreductase
MELTQLGRSGLRVSQLCLGAMTFGREADEADSAAIVDTFLAAGGTFIDTADAYGEPVGRSEEIVGRAVASRRDQVVLATKVNFPTGRGANDKGLSRRHIRAGVEDSLRRLGTEWIDLYQVHNWDPFTPLTETLSTLDDLVREGKVRYIGASNYAGWHLAKALGLSALHGWEPFVALQANYSLIARDLERELLPLCRADGLAVLPYGPLGGGILTGKYAPEVLPDDSRARTAKGVASFGITRGLNERNFDIVEAVRAVAADLGRTPGQVALNWVMQRAGVTSPIIGARTVEQLTSNLGALGWRLENDSLARLEQASAFELGYPYDFHTWTQQAMGATRPAAGSL